MTSDDPKPPQPTQKFEQHGYLVVVNDCEMVARCETNEDAALIVRAVNAHDALVEACEAALACIREEMASDNVFVSSIQWDATKDKLRAALELAKAKPQGEP